MQPPLQPALAALPPGVFSAADYAALAPQFMAPATLAHVIGGSGTDATVAANRAAFDRHALLPRLLADLRDGHTHIALGGRTLAHPLLLAPVAHQRLVHPQAELATALAAEATDTTLVLSTGSSVEMERVAASTNAPKWFQLYLQPTREITLNLVQRAEQAGFEALMLTLDAPVQAPSLRALHAGFKRPPPAESANLTRYQLPTHARPGAAASAIFQGPMQWAPRWDDIDWLQRNTRLPLWIKGVLHPDDASALAARGVAGLVVSNHGGRALDGAPASLQMLPALRRAVGAALPLLFDGGITSGSDVFKALALGANAVMVGRLQLHALAVAGALGVAHMLRLLREELELTMALAGCATPTDIGAHCLHPQPHQDEAPPC